MGTGAQVVGERLEEDGDVEPRMSSEKREKCGSGVTTDREERDEKTLSIMSPFDEQEEWAKISEIMASFGTGLVRESVFVSELEKEFQARLGMVSDTGSPYVLTLVGQWLSKLNLADYESLFLNYGFDDLDFINGVLDESDLKDMGITSEKDRSIITEAVSLLPNNVEKRNHSRNQTVDDWLKSINLENYSETFKKHLYLDMERVRRVWEVELAAVLEIQKPAHRKRILASVSNSSPRTNIRNGSGPNFEDINKDLTTLKTNIQQLKEEIREKLPAEVVIQSNGLTTPTKTLPPNSSNTGTLKHRKNRPAPQPPQKPNSLQNGGAVQAPEKLEIRAPSELLLGVPSTLKTQWRHQPKDLVNGSYVTYVANYLGSTVVKELKGTESTKKSIQKLRKNYQEPKETPDIALAISYRGVRFLNVLTDEPICEHEIRNIHCACQDADDLTHFAYITKDHSSKTHFCHVFCVPTMDQATEIILTLGQAFEVAYQIALKEKFGGQAVRSKSSHQLSNLASSPSKCLNVDSNGRGNSINHDNKYSTNPRLKPTRSKSNPNPLSSLVNTNANSNNSVKTPSSASRESPSSPSRSNNSTNHTSTNMINYNKHFNNSNISPIHYGKSGNVNNTNSINTVKLLASHGRSHSVNDIKINGNQLKLVPMPVDDISIGNVKDMKAGSRAPIALSEEL